MDISFNTRGMVADAVAVQQVAQAKPWDPFAHPDQIRFSARSRALDCLSKIYYGRQYEGRPDWWTGQRYDGDCQAPLRDRKPCRVYKLPGAATRQVVRFLFGSERWPDVRVKPTVTEDENGDVKRLDSTAYELTEDDAKTLQGWLADVIDRCGVKTHERALATQAIATGTGVSALTVRHGLFDFETLRAQDCWPRFDDDDASGEVLELVQCYEIEKEVDIGDGKPIQKRFLYRRNWTAGSTWSYPDVELVEGLDPKWGTPSRTPSNLSFVPVIWVRNGELETRGLDGSSLFCNSESDIQALDFSASQRYRGIAYLGTPQPVETGVGGEDSGAQGDCPRHAGPNEFWSYEGEKVNVSLLETSGKSYEVASLHVRDIRSELLEQWGVVLTNTTDTVGRIGTGNEMSGRFLEIAHAPLLALISEYRDTWWRSSLERLLQMCLRACVEIGGVGLLIPGSREVAQIGRRFLVTETEDGVSETRWVGPLLEPVWGRYFTPDDTEVKTAVDAASVAKKEGLVTQETALRYVGSDFGVHDISEELDRLEGEAEEAAAEAQAQQEAEMEQLHALAGSQQNPVRARAGEDEAQAAGDGGGATVAAPSPGPTVRRAAPRASPGKPAR